MTRRSTITEFIEKSNLIHNDEYDYSLVEYVDSKTKVKIICLEHGEFLKTPDKHLRGEKCIKCADNNRKKTNLERYGSECSLANKEIQEKIKKTNIERYGFENPLFNKDIQEKIKKTNIERYGFENPLFNKNIYNKAKKTMLKRYGVEHTAKSAELFEKIKNTNIKRFGHESPFGNKEIQEIKKLTNIKRFGHESPFGNKEIQEKIKLNSLNNFGTNNHSQKHMVAILPLITNKEWLFEQYITLCKTATIISKELGIADSTVGIYLHKAEIEIRYTVGYSVKCIKWLESIMEQEGIFIQHAGNIGEFKIPGTRYKADGYCQENNTIYEFHGDCFHGNPDLFEDDDRPNFYKPEITAKELYNKTIERENKIINLGYNLVTTWENDYDTF